VIIRFVLIQEGSERRKCIEITVVSQIHSGQYHNKDVRAKRNSS